MYTGLHYVGRDSLLIASCDAVISIGGRLGTLHEFTIAMEMEKPIGFVEGTGGTGVEIRDILKAAGHARASNVFFDTDAKRLLKKLEHSIRQRYGENHKAFTSNELECEFCANLSKKLRTSK